jgi:hypothetical protein
VTGVVLAALDDGAATGVSDELFDDLRTVISGYSSSR